MRNRIVLMAIAAGCMLPVAALTAWADDLSDELLAQSRKGNIQAVKDLLDKGADVNAKSSYGQTPLFFASDRGNVELVKLLLDKGANPNAKDTFYNATALTWAAMKGRVEVIRLLFAKGATDADAVFMGGMQNGNKELIKVALESGKVKTATLNYGLSMALKAKKDDIAEILKAAGAKPPAPATFTVDAETLARYAGKYMGGRGGTETELVLAVSDGKLAITSPQNLTLAPLDKTHFRGVEFEGLEVEFVNTEGTITSMKVTNPGGTSEFKKVAAK